MAQPLVLTPPTTAFWTHFSGHTWYESENAPPDFSETVSRVGLYFFRQAFGQEVEVTADEAILPTNDFYTVLDSSITWKLFTGFMAIILSLIAIIGAIAYYCSDTCERDWKDWQRDFQIGSLKRCDATVPKENVKELIRTLCEGEDYRDRIYPWLIDDKTGLIQQDWFKQAMFELFTVPAAPPTPSGSLSELPTPSGSRSLRSRSDVAVPKSIHDANFMPYLKSLTTD
jgi:hypothetical protein